MTTELQCRRVGRISQPRAPSGGDARKGFDCIDRIRQSAPVVRIENTRRRSRLLGNSGISIRHSRQDVFPVGAGPTRIWGSLKIKVRKIMIHSGSPEGREYFVRQELKLRHNMIVWHAGKVQTTDEMVNAKCFHEAFNLDNAIV